MLDGREAYINDENEFGHYPEGTWVLLKRYSLGGNRTRVLTRKLRRSALWKIIWNGAMAEERDKWSGGSLGWTLGDIQCLLYTNLTEPRSIWASGPTITNLFLHPFSVPGLTVTIIIKGLFSVKYAAISICQTESLQIRQEPAKHRIAYH